MFEFSQRRRSQYFEIDLNLIGIGIFQIGLARVNDLNDFSQLITCEKSKQSVEKTSARFVSMVISGTRQFVNTQAQLPFLVISHRFSRVLLIATIYSNDSGIPRPISEDKTTLFNEIVGPILATQRNVRGSPLLIGCSPL